MEIGILTAFAGGVISFLSPCVLPLAPPYLAYLGGTTLDRISGEEREADPRLARHVFVSACFFVLGLATVFVALVYGVLDEIHQSGVEGRASEVEDVVADVFGAVLIVVFWFFLKRYRASSGEQASE